MNLIWSHPTVSALAAFFLFSAVVSGMPHPEEIWETPQHSAVYVAYLWMFRTLNILTANIGSALSRRGLQVPTVPPGGVQVQENKTVTAAPPL